MTPSQQQKALREVAARTESRRRQHLAKGIYAIVAATARDDYFKAYRKLGEASTFYRRLLAKNPIRWDMQDARDDYKRTIRQQLKLMLTHHKNYLTTRTPNDAA